MVTGVMDQKRDKRFNGRGKGDAWCVLAIAEALPPDQKSERTAPAASCAGESADNSDDLKAGGVSAHGNGAEIIRAVGEGKGKFGGLPGYCFAGGWVSVPAALAGTAFFALDLSCQPVAGSGETDT